jgi:lipopolysaccharide transport system ATP-binding protein
MGAALFVDNLSKEYRLGQQNARRWLGQALPSGKQNSDVLLKALDGVSFGVEQGEVLGIMGRNGAGKSTLLKLLSRITAPSSGQIKQKGRMASLLEVGTGFHPDLTGRENVFLNGAILGMRKAEVRQRLDEIVEFAGVSAFLDTPVKRYSSGMYVRLAFAVAAHLDPEILIIDEVLAVGDAEFQKKCVDKMKSASAGQGKTILFVSHNLAFVQALCPRAILLEQGRLKADGPTADVIQHYIQGIQSSRDSLTRSGNLLAELQSLQMYNEKDQPSALIQQGQPCSFVLEYHAKQALEQVGVALGFNDMGGQRILSVWSEFQQQRFSFSPGMNTIRITLPAMKLMPANYMLASYLTASGILVEDVVDVQQLLVVAPPLKEGFAAPSLNQGVFNDEATILLETPNK